MSFDSVKPYWYVTSTTRLHLHKNLQGFQLMIAISKLPQGFSGNLGSNVGGRPLSSFVIFNRSPMSQAGPTSGSLPTGNHPPEDYYQLASFIQENPCRKTCLGKNVTWIYMDLLEDSRHLLTSSVTFLSEPSASSLPYPRPPRNRWGKGLPVVPPAAVSLRSLSEASSPRYTNGKWKYSYISNHYRHHTCRRPQAHNLQEYSASLHNYKVREKKLVKQNIHEGDSNVQVEMLIMSCYTKGNTSSALKACPLHRLGVGFWGLFFATSGLRA